MSYGERDVTVALLSMVEGNVEPAGHEWSVIDADERTLFLEVTTPDGEVLTFDVDVRQTFPRPGSAK